MTIEELNYIKDAFSLIIEDIAGNPDWPEAARAVASDLGTLERKLEEKVASIPSGLDEAAEKYSENILANNEDLQDAIEDAFKAGAEWMAGQGIYVDAGVCKLVERAWITPMNERQFQRDLCDNFVAGDKVIVQIRKKQ